MILAVLLLAAPVQALTIDQAHRAALTEPHKAEFRIAHDSWVLTDDKAAHWGIGFAGATISAWAANAHTTTEKLQILEWNAGFWTLWEIKDALIPWETYGAIGGDGFSYKDWVYSVTGAVAAMLIRH